LKYKKRRIFGIKLRRTRKKRRNPFRIPSVFNAVRHDLAEIDESFDFSNEAYIDIEFSHDFKTIPICFRSLP